jgi:hypothetical protein
VVDLDGDGSTGTISKVRLVKGADVDYQLDTVGL